MATKKPKAPVFKIYAEVSCWKQGHTGGSLTGEGIILHVKEALVVLSVANLCDIKNMVLATIKGKLSFYGATADMDFEFDAYEIYTSRSRKTDPLFGEPIEWFPVVDSVSGAYTEEERAKAIKAKTFLPFDRKEQREVYS